MVGWEWWLSHLFTVLVLKEYHSTMQIGEANKSERNAYFN